MTDFEGWLRDRLHQVGLNITELADALHTSRSTIYQWIDGKAKPLDATGQDLARILRVTGAELQEALGRAKPRTPHQEEVLSEVRAIFEHLAESDQQFALQLLRDLLSHAANRETDQGPAR